MKPWLFLFLIGLDLWAGDLTIYTAHGPRFGGSEALKLYIDGKYIGKMLGKQRFTMQLPDGKHMVRVGEDMFFATVIDLKGSCILRIYDGGGIPWTEVLLVDPVAKAEFESCDPVNKLML